LNFENLISSQKTHFLPTVQKNYFISSLFLNEIAIFKNKLFRATHIFKGGVTIFLPRDDITRFDGTLLAVLQTRGLAARLGN
jgi:uncharacterized membrane protein SpoIIM required for sporulation